jgi:hypothetical protein
MERAQVLEFIKSSGGSILERSVEDIEAALRG